MGRFEVVRDEFRKHSNIEIQLPVRASAKAGAYDLYAPEAVTIPPNEAAMIWTDLKAQFEDNEMLLLNVRSSMGKKRIMLANTQGWIDSDYYGNSGNDGNIGLLLYNFGTEPYEIAAGDRIGQAMLVQHGYMDNTSVEGERSGGFGSTGK